MGIALLALSDLLSPLQSLAGRMAAAPDAPTRRADGSRKARAVHQAVATRIASRVIAAADAARTWRESSAAGDRAVTQTLAAWRHALTRAAVARIAALRRAPAPYRAPVHARPLRVVRFCEDSAAPSAGRVVLSGRLDDVCAELDRLARLEEAQDRRSTDQTLH